MIFREKRAFELPKSLPGTVDTYSTDYGHGYFILSVELGR